MWQQYGSLGGQQVKRCIPTQHSNADVKKSIFLMLSSHLNSENFPKKWPTYLSNVLVQPLLWSELFKKKSSFFSHIRGMDGLLVDLLDPSHTPSPTIRHTNTITHCSCLEVETLTQAPYSIIEIYCVVRRFRSSLWAGRKMCHRIYNHQILNTHTMIIFWL